MVSMVVAVTVTVAVSMAAIILIFIVTVKIPVVITIPAMLVFYSASLPGPVTHEIPPTLVVRPDPIGSFIGRHRPVTCMPPIMVADRIPVAFHPYIVGPRWRRLNVHPRRRWRSDHDSNRNLRSNR